MEVVDLICKNQLIKKVSEMTTKQIMESLSNDERRLLCCILLENEKKGYYDGPAISFVYRSGNVFIAVDNRTHDCWIEEFKSADHALAWATDPEGELSW